MSIQSNGPSNWGYKPNITPMAKNQGTPPNNRNQGNPVSFRGGPDKEAGFWSRVYQFLTAPFRWIASWFASNPNPESTDAESKSQANLNREESLKGEKKRLLSHMMQGLASDYIEVRENARKSLRNLGLSDKEMDRIRLELECKKQESRRR